MAKNYKYGIRLGASVDEDQIKLSMKKVSNYLAKDSNMQSVKIKLDSSEFEKEIVNVKKLVDNITGKDIGNSYTMRIGEQFYEIQESVKGTIKSVEMLDSSFSRLSDGITPIDNITKRIDTLKETVEQLNHNSKKSVSASDMNELISSLKTIDDLTQGITEEEQKQLSIKAQKNQYKDEISQAGAEEKLAKTRANNQRITTEILKSSLETNEDYLAVVNKINTEEQNNLDIIAKIEDKKKEILSLENKSKGESDLLSSMGLGDSKSDNAIQSLLGNMGLSDGGEISKAKEDVVDYTAAIKSSKQEFNKLLSEKTKSNKLIKSATEELSQYTKEIDNSISMEKALNDELKEAIKNRESLETAYYSSKQPKNGTDNSIETALNKQLKESYDAEAYLAQTRHEQLNATDLAIKKVNNSSQEYNQTLTSLTSDLKKLFKEEQSLQNLKNKAELKGNSDEVNFYKEKISLVKEEQTLIKKSLTDLTGNSNLQKELTNEHKLTLKAQNESYQLTKKITQAKSEEKQLADKINTTASNLSKLYTEDLKQQKLLMTAKQKSNDDDAKIASEKIAILKKEEGYAKSALTRLTGSNALQKEITAEYAKKLALQEQSYLVSQNNSKALSEQKQEMNEYIRRYKEYVDLQIELATAQSKLENSGRTPTDIDNDYIDSLRTRISLTEEYLSSKRSENALLEENVRVKESVDTQNRRLESSKSRLLSQYQDEKLSLQDVSNTVTNAIFSYNLLERAIDGVVDSIRYSVQQVLELNQAMVDVQMITNGTDAETAKLASTYSEMAKDLGATTAEVAASSSEWLRQGKTVEETNELIQASMVLSKVGAIESAEASQILTSVMNGYKLSVEDAMKVVDSFSAVDLAAATSVEELGVAMQRTANIAKDVGVEFDTLVGYIASVSETTRRSAETVGESFKTILSRFTNVKAGVFIDPDTGEAINIGGIAA